jgi:hemerythrin-like domain-containing protein
MATLPSKADVAQDVLRIHAIITRALNVSAEHAETYAQGGFSDAAAREGLVSYVRCLAVLLHAHHLTEDESVFPYFQDKLPDAPYEALVAQHRHMDPILDAIKTALEDVSGTVQPGPALRDLNNALVEMRTLWQTHIDMEETHLSSERIGAVIDDAEQERMSKAFAKHAQAHQMGQVPVYWLIPFLVYNLSGQDRAWMAQQIPWIVTRVLLPTVWRKKWLPMTPLLLE